jgi:nicotinamide-nucleotide amidase
VGGHPQEEGLIETFSEPLPADIHCLAESLMRAACGLSLTLSVAESCTGGLLAAVLTDVEGCAHAFDRGFVAYTDGAKRELLGVPAEVLSGPGAVSAPAAKAMALGALDASKAQLAISITGFAGRGAIGEEPGLSFIGLARRYHDVQVIERHFGDIGRAAVRLECLRVALRSLGAELDRIGKPPAVAKPPGG